MRLVLMIGIFIFARLVEIPEENVSFISSLLIFGMAYAITLDFVEYLSR